MVFRGWVTGEVPRLTQCWEAEHHEWHQRDPSAKRYVYWWVDVIQLRVRLGGDNVCLSTLDRPKG